MSKFNELVTECLATGAGLPWYPESTGDENVRVEDLIETLENNCFHAARKFLEVHSFKRLNRKVKEIVKNKQWPTYIYVHPDKTRCYIGYHPNIVNGVNTGMQLWICIIGRNEQH